jgi:hypothetical protein
MSEPEWKNRALAAEAVLREIIEAFRRGEDLKPLIYGEGKALDLALTPAQS